MCRASLPPICELNPSYALREGSITYTKLLLEIEQLSTLCADQANEIKLANSRKAAKDPIISAKSDAKWHEQNEVDENTLAMIQQLENDEEYARKLQDEINGLNLVPPPPPASTLDGDEFSFISEKLNGIVQRISSSPRGRQMQEKFCGHTCTMTLLVQCCWCSDPRDPDCNVITIYRDDSWVEEIMPRDSYYCLECKGKEDRL